MSCLPSAGFTHTMSVNPSYPPSLQSYNSPSIFTDQTSTDHSSSASLTFSEANYDLANDDMDQNRHGGAEDVSTVMTQVLIRMDRIVEHLRLKGEHQAANNIAKDIISIITSFNAATAPWDIETSSLRPIGYTAPASNPISSHPRTAITSPPLSTISSWAAIAAVEPAPGNRLVKFTPNDSVRTRYQELSPEVEAQDEYQRVVWIRGWQDKDSLSEVTSNIGQGPIYSMAYSPKDRSVCVIFMHASSAKELMDDDNAFSKRAGHSRFGPGRELIIGLPYPTNDDINLMNSPTNERRRLTFARQQLFTNGMTEERFKADIYSIVGQANVELIWLFNTGNATVVLSAVPLARMVRNEFRRYSQARNSPYHGVVVSFSHDPCERPMSLITQMPAGHTQRSMGTYGGHGAMPAVVASKSMPPYRRNTSTSNSSNATGNHNSRTVVDANGWQTVPSRKR